MPFTKTNATPINSIILICGLDKHLGNRLDIILDTLESYFSDQIFAQAVTNSKKKN
jgi:hypothetical protein